MVALKGTPVLLKGTFPKVGAPAPSFDLVDRDLSAVTLDSFGKKRKVLNIFISLDTPVCSKSMHAFHASLQSIPNVVLINISMDLPFAFSRFCTAENLPDMKTLSAFRSSFLKDYGVEIADGPLKGLAARAVIVLGEDNKVLYTQLVDEITTEPDYQAALVFLS